jgi:hypothetical protein
MSMIAIPEHRLNGGLLIACIATDWDTGVTRPGKLIRAKLENSACVVRLVPVWQA